MALIDSKPFRVTVIGNGAAMPAAGKYHSSHVLNVHNRLFLLDCGEGTQKAMLENGINPQKLKAVFLTHLHGDHMYGLFPLLDTLSLSQRSQPLRVFAPAGLSDLMNCISRTLYGGRPYSVECHAVDTTSHRIVFENDKLEIWSIPLMHRVPSVGYLFREKPPVLSIRKDRITEYSIRVEELLSLKRGEDLIRNNAVIPNSQLTYRPYVPRSYAYCTDTIYSPQVADFVKHVDVLYHEASFACSEGELAKRNGHSTAAEAARIASLAGVKKLLIGHFSGRYKDPSRLVDEAKEVFPETEEAEQGKTYEIGTKSSLAGSFPQSAR